MPITVTAPRGLLTTEGEREVLPRLTTALLDATGAAGNSFFTGIVGGTVHLLDPAAVYAGGVNHPLVLVELKLPDTVLADSESLTAFIAEATDIVDDLTTSHARSDTWVNVLHARDGAWGIGGVAHTSETLAAAGAATT